MGARRVRISAGLVVQWLRFGTPESRPHDAMPADMRVVAVRLAYPGLRDDPIFEVIVSSASFTEPGDAADDHYVEAGWEEVPLWVLMFDRVQHGGQPPAASQRPPRIKPLRETLGRSRFKALPIEPPFNP